MLTGLLSLVVYLLVIGLVIWLLLYLLDTIPVPAPFHNVLRIVIIVIGVIAVIYALLGLVNGGPVFGRL